MRVLRLARASSLVTARVFEELFERELGTLLEVRRAPLDRWCGEVLGDAPDSAAAAARFASATRDVDFLCPSYEGAALAPLFLSLRNRGHSAARLLLIAHSPALLPMEWALLPPLLAPGDVVVAPSEAARRAVLFLCEELAPWVHVIPHPMKPLLGVALADPARPRLVSLGRLHPGKLVHRQVEAMSILRDRGHRTLRFDVAGDAGDSYGRVLAEQIRRFGLVGQVRLVGEVAGEGRKADFLSGATALLNLSVTLEESFGKAPVEALGAGIPVVVSGWNGLPETIGPCGGIAPVSLVGGGAMVDVSALALADTIEQLLSSPTPASDCIEHSRRFGPDAIRARYRSVLLAAMDARRGRAGIEPWPDDTHCAAPRGGLLHSLAPLTHLSWRELFAASLESATWMRAGWNGRPLPPSRGDRLRSLLLAGSRVPLERHFGGLAPVVVPDDATLPASRPEGARPLGDAIDAALVDGAASAGAVLTSRVACLLELRELGAADAAWEGLARIEAEGFRAPGITFLRVEALDERGEPAEALDHALAAWRAAPPEELEAHRVRQVARLARRAGRPAEALPWLEEWLARHPVTAASGAVWLDCSAAAMREGDREISLAALDEARRLLGDDEPAVVVVARALARRDARLAVA